MTVPKGPVVRALFARIVRRYDLLNSLLSLGMVGRWRRFTLTRTGLRPGDAALDVCAGTGTLSVELARQVGSGGQVTGLDFCGPMLDDARRRFPASRWPQLSFTEGDAHRLPYRDATWHAITMAFGLRNLEAPGQ
ncbi:MAG TPA: class I SAM-dependent methyltransferase, partial [Candidatus Xenobia bacterium]